MGFNRSIRCLSIYTAVSDHVEAFYFDNEGCWLARCCGGYRRIFPPTEIQPPKKPTPEASAPEAKPSAGAPCLRADRFSLNYFRRSLLRLRAPQRDQAQQLAGGQWAGISSRVIFLGGICFPTIVYDHTRTMFLFVTSLSPAASRPFFFWDVFSCFGGAAILVPCVPLFNKNRTSGEEMGRESGGT